jgi:hypothetical protein
LPQYTHCGADNPHVIPAIVLANTVSRIAEDPETPGADPSSY